MEAAREVFEKEVDSIVLEKKSFGPKRQKMGFGVEASVDCGSDGSPIESYYSSWSDKLKPKILLKPELLLLF